MSAPGSKERQVSLRAVAHARSGDKGRTLNVAVIAYEPAAFVCIAPQLTAEAFAAWYGGLFDGPVTRYEIPRLGAFNFVCEGALGGGVSRNLCLDNYGKSLASCILDFPLLLPEQPDFAIRQPVGDPLLPYLRQAGLQPAELQGSPWQRALFPGLRGEDPAPAAPSARPQADTEAAKRAPQNEDRTGGMHHET